MKLKPKSTVKNPKALVYKRFTEVDIGITNHVYWTPDPFYPDSNNDKYWVFDSSMANFIEVEKPAYIYGVRPTAEDLSKGIIIQVDGLKYYKYSQYYFMYYDFAYQWIRDIAGDTILTHVDGYTPSGYADMGDSKRANQNTKIKIETGANFQPHIITGYYEYDGNFYKFETDEIVYDEQTGEFPAVIVVSEIISANSVPVQLFQNELYWTDTNSGESGGYTINFSWQVKRESLGIGFPKVSKYQTNKYYYSGCFDYMIKGSIEGTTAQYIKGNIIPLKSLNIKYFADDIDLSPDDLVVINNHLYSVENPETVLKQQPKPFKVYFATLNNIL